MVAARWRRARRRSRYSSTRGSETSQRRAITTMAVALSATAMRARSAAGRAGEEDHPVGVAGDVLEPVHELRLAAAAAGGRGHRGPHPVVELPAELLDE